jgi:O-antigen ligase
MIVGTVDTEDKLKKFVWVYVFCMLVLVGEPFLLSLQGKNLFVKEGGVVRLYGVGQFGHPNGLGTNAVTTLPFLYFLFWHYRSFILRGFLAGFALVCLRVIMLTASRTAYVGVLIFVVLIFYYSAKKLRFALITVLLSTIFITAVPKMYRERFLSLSEVADVVESDEREQSSIGGRWALVQDAWGVFLKYPIFGCGMDSFRRIGREEKEFDSMGQTHNLLMQVLAESGLIGLFGFGFFLLAIWKNMKESKFLLTETNARSEYLFTLIMILQVFFLTKLFIGLVAQHSMYSRVWWIIAGLILVAVRILREQVQLDTDVEVQNKGILKESYQYSQTDY